jgi:hypothetical protein
MPPGTMRSISRLNEREAVARRHPLEDQVTDQEVEAVRLREQLVGRAAHDVLHALRFGLESSRAQHARRSIDRRHCPRTPRRPSGERKRQPARAASVLENRGRAEVGRQPQLDRPPHEIDERLAAREELAADVDGEIGAQESGIGENREVRFVRVTHAGSIVSYAIDRARDARQAGRSGVHLGVDPAG